MKKLIAVTTLGLFAAACSNEPATAPEAETEVTATAPTDADDDALEPEAPKVEEAEEHNEEAPHSH